jgi:hypothetical protein
MRQFWANEPCSIRVGVKYPFKVVPWQVIIQSNPLSVWALKGWGSQFAAEPRLNNAFVGGLNIC